MLTIVWTCVDHFEPFNGGVDFSCASERVRSWIDGYRIMARKFHDALGRPPQHTIFYPPHHDQQLLVPMLELWHSGFVEIEMHLHHNKMSPFPDDSRTLRKKIQDTIDAYSKHGIFCQPDGSRRFAFIHGDWSLDNSLGSHFCGVNDEISILRDCGCFADFTFPSLGKAQPRLVNKMYYCHDNPLRPKSHNWGRELIAGVPQNDDLLIVQGVLGLRWKSRTHRFKPSIEASNVDESDQLTQDRIDYLVRHAIRIKGRSDICFVKLHTHSARESAWNAVWGIGAERAHEYLTSHYNDGIKYRLLYATAREMFNLIKAVEGGVSGDITDYINYLILPYIKK